MNEPLDLYMMITIPRFRMYSQKMAHLLSIIQIFKHLLEMYKIKSNLSESCLTNLFSVANGNYNLPSQSDFRVPGTNTDFYGTNSIGNFGSVIRNSLPNDFTFICDFDLFKTTIRIWIWKPVDCPCRLCKSYIDGFGFVNVSSEIYQAVYAKAFLFYVQFELLFIGKLYMK